MFHAKKGCEKLLDWKEDWLTINYKITVAIFLSTETFFITFFLCLSFWCILFIDKWMYMFLFDTNNKCYAFLYKYIKIIYFFFKKYATFNTIFLRCTETFLTKYSSVINCSIQVEDVNACGNSLGCLYFRSSDRKIYYMHIL